MWHHSWTPEFGIKVFALNLAISYCLFTLYLQTAVLWVALSCPLQTMWTQHTSVHVNWNSSLSSLVSGPSRALLNKKKQTWLLSWEVRPSAQFSISLFCGLNPMRSRILWVASLSLWQVKVLAQSQLPWHFRPLWSWAIFFTALGLNVLIWKGFVIVIFNAFKATRRR